MCESTLPPFFVREFRACRRAWVWGMLRLLALLPLELVWRIAVYANNVRDIRLLCREAQAMRPERSVLYRQFEWVSKIQENELREYFTMNEFVKDLYMDLEDLMWGPGEVWQPRARRRRYCAQPFAYLEPLEHVSRYQMRIVHEAYGLPRMLVRRLRRNKRWGVLALVH